MSEMRHEQEPEKYGLGKEEEKEIKKTTSTKVEEAACHACGIDGGGWMERAPTPGTTQSQGPSLPHKLARTLQHLLRPNKILTQVLSRNLNETP